LKDGAELVGDMVHEGTTDSPSAAAQQASG
jgi:hypothetical protein